MTASREDALSSAWQAALAAEHQAVYGYALLGPHLAVRDRQPARDCEAAHATLRDAATAALTAAHHEPQAPQPDYPALYPVGDETAARRLAARLETEAAAAWRYLYAVAAEGAGSETDPVRRTAQAALTDSAVRAVQWRGAPVPFPGV